MSREDPLMKKRFTDEQIAFALRQAEAGTPVAEVCRKLKQLVADRPAGV